MYQGRRRFFLKITGNGKSGKSGNRKKTGNGESGKPGKKTGKSGNGKTGNFSNYFLHIKFSKFMDKQQRSTKQSATMFIL
jgi:hypothetical protein